MGNSTDANPMSMNVSAIETIATLMAPSALDNSSALAYDVAPTSASSLVYWSGNVDGVAAANGIVVQSPPVSELPASLLADAFASNQSDSFVTDVLASSAASSFYDVYANSNGSLADDMNFNERCQSFDVNANISYWNVTCDTPLSYADPLYGLCMPFLLVITVLANTLIVLVLRKKHMATPTNFVLMVMAICDMLTVIFPAPGLWYMYVFGNHYKPLHPVSMCLTYSIFNEIMPAMCHTTSIWLTVALAVQRYIYVCHAPMARTWCTMPRVKRCTVYIALGSFLHQSTRFFDRTYYPVTIEWSGQITEVCHMETANWVHDYIGEDVYFTVYYLSRVLFVHLLPCIILVTLNILLFRAMQQAQERRKLLFRENRKKECKRLRESNCTTLMLIVVVTVFLIVEIPIAVMTIMHIVSSLIIPFLDYRIANIFIMFTNFFLVVSYPINFGIYCGMSRQFRETFKEIFLGRILRSTKKDNSSKYSIVNGPRTTCSNTNETVL